MAAATTVVNVTVRFMPPPCWSLGGAFAAEQPAVNRSYVMTSDERTGLANDSDTLLERNRGRAEQNRSGPST
jgi:hypothetical protein